MLTRRDVYGREDVALLTASESAALDRAARERGGVPERVLMENAGRTAAQVLGRLYPRGSVVAAVGSGNNGGDALVLLRALRSWGRDVSYVQAGSRAPDAALAHGWELPRVEAERAAQTFADAVVLVDGILGTGAAGEPREPAATVIRAMNASGRPVVALDVPSGVDPTTGRVPGLAVHAAVTVTFGWPKRGMMLQPARSHCGRLVTVEIGFPPAGAELAPAAALITPAWATARLPVRPPAAHKGGVGRLLILAGSPGMAGAAAIAGRAAQRAGAGLVRLASSPANRQILQLGVPEAVFVDRTDPAALEAAAADVAALVAGPGMGLDDEAGTALRQALSHAAGQPALLDADALTLFARDPDALRELATRGPVVVTPHPGELHRLTGLAIEAIRSDPFTAAGEFAERTGCVVLLKGTPSVVAAPGERVLVNSVGSSDLASAGMGDQLAGTVGAVLAAGVAARTAAAVGLFFSGRAADLAGRGRSLAPDDVTDHLDRAFAAPGAARSSLALPFVAFDQPPRW